MAFKISKKHVRFGTIGIVALAGVYSYLRPSPLQTDPDLQPLAQQAGFLRTGGQNGATPGPEEGAAASPDIVETAPLPLAQVTRSNTRPAAEPVLHPELPAAPERARAPALPTPGAEDRPEVAIGCTPSMKIISVPGGLVYFLVEAPCATPGPTDVTHAGLSITLPMPATGRLAATIPLLDIEEPFRAVLADGSVIEQRLDTASAAAFEHIVLQWSGETGLHLHALEFGADYGSSGHVWAGAPKEVLRGVRGEGGFLTRLGSPRLGDTAEVYSFPAGAMAGEGSVRMTVEAEVTAANCGKDISGELLQRNLDGRITSAPLMFAVPECDAIGDILVLKNILQDLKIAAN